MKRKLKVLILCEESQAECFAFRNLGHIAFSCDILDCRKGGKPEWHIRGNARLFLNGLKDFVTMDGKKHHVESWDLIIAHPPCTFLSKISSQWLYHEPDWHCTVEGVVKEVNFDRWQKMRAARHFFLECLNAPALHVAVENPLPMAIANLPTPSCYACPSWYGAKYTKKTLYWTKNLPPLMPTIINPKATSLMKSTRGKYRSRTNPLLAAAVAKQWSEAILSEP